MISLPETKHHQERCHRFHTERRTKLVHPLPKGSELRSVQNEQNCETRMRDKASEESGQHLAGDKSRRLSRQITKF